MNRRNAIILGGYAALLLVVFHQVWRGQMFFGWDCLREYWPDIVYAKRAIADGELPLWNPNALAGYSFWGDPQAGLLAPVNWLCWVLGWIFHSDGPWLIQLKVLVNLWIGLVGMHFLAAKRARCDAAAVVAAVVLVFGSPLLVHKNGAYLWPWLYLPWAILALERFTEAPGPRRAAALALAVGLCGSAGHPQAFFYALIIISAYWAYLLASSPKRIREQAVGIAVFVVLAAAFLLPVYLPAAQAVAASPRSHRGLGYVLQGSLEPGKLVELLYPNLDDDWMGDVYVGPVALLVGLYGIFAASGETRRQRLFWLGIAVFGMVLALGQYAGLLGFLAEHVPGFGLFRIAYRHKLIFGFAIAVLAGDGVGSLARGEGHLWLRRGLAIAAGLWIVGAIFVKAAALAAAPALVLVVLIATGLVRNRYMMAALAVAATLDLYVAGKTKLDIMQPPPSLAADAARVAKMPGIDGPWRFQNDGVLPYYFPYLYDVREQSGFLNPVELARHEDLVGRIKTAPALLQKLNVRWWLTGKKPANARVLEGNLYEFPDAVPLARVYPRAESLARPAVLDRMSNAEPLAVALVEPEDAPAGLPTGEFAPTDGELVSYRRNRVEVSVESPAAGILVLNEAYFPGWTAEINGAPAPIFRANYLLRAVVVPAGKSQVVFVFSPRGLLPLGIAFVLAWLAVLGLHLAKRRVE